MKKIIGLIIILPFLITIFIVAQIVFTFLSIFGFPFWIGVDLVNDSNYAIDTFIETNKIPYKFISLLWE